MLLAGFGFLSRMYGLSIDNVVEVEMVLADGRIVVLDKDTDPGEQESHSYHSCFGLKLNRSVVGHTRCWSSFRYRHQIQSHGVPDSGGIRRKSYLVRIDPTIPIGG